MSKKSKLRTEIEKFINNLSNNVKISIGKIKLIHDKLKQVDPKTDTIPYMVFYEWGVEVLSYGILLAIVYFDLFILTGWLKWLIMPFSLGAIRWLWLDFVETTTDRIKGKK